jgi:hypothetical protein
MTREEWEAKYGAEGNYGDSQRSTYASSGRQDEVFSGFLRGYADWLRKNTKIDGITRAHKGQWAEWASQDPGYRAKDLAIRPGETKASWLARLDKDHFPGFSEFIQSQPGVQDFFDSSFTPESGPDGQSLDEYRRQQKKEADGKRGDVMSQIQAFADQLTKPFDVNDPEIKQIMTMAGNRASDQARLQGVQGPAGLTDMQASMNKTGLGAYNERKQLGLGALGLLNQADTARMEMDFREKQAQAQALREHQAQQMGLSALHEEKHAAPWRSALSIGSSVVGALAAPFTGGLSLAGAIPGLASSIFGGGGQSVPGGGSNGYSSAGGGLSSLGSGRGRDPNSGPR